MLERSGLNLTEQARETKRILADQSREAERIMAERTKETEKILNEKQIMGNHLLPKHFRKWHLLPLNNFRESLFQESCSYNP